MNEQITSLMNDLRLEREANDRLILELDEFVGMQQRTTCSTPIQEPRAWRFKEYGFTCYDKEQMLSYINKGWQVVEILYSEPITKGNNMNHTEVMKQALQWFEWFHACNSNGPQASSYEIKNNLKEVLSKLEAEQVNQPTK